MRPNTLDKLGLKEREPTGEGACLFKAALEPTFKVHEVPIKASLGG
jgi:hypothetical protein